MNDAHGLSVDVVSISISSLFGPTHWGSFSIVKPEEAGPRHGVSFLSCTMGLQGLTSLRDHCAVQQ